MKFDAPPARGFTVPIPKFINIQGRRVNIEVKEELALPSTDKFQIQGLHIGWLNKIELCSLLAPDELRATAVHEIIHDLDSIIGLRLSEKEVTALSTVIFATIRDNPKLIEWLQERK